MLYSVCGIGTLLLALQYIFLARQFINCVETSRYVHPWAEQEDWNILVEKLIEIPQKMQWPPWDSQNLYCKTVGLLLSKSSSGSVRIRIILPDPDLTVGGCRNVYKKPRLLKLFAVS